ncbi:MAG TPA: sugar ABC transporter ATP-binding protein [Spirochaetia bacterium]|nr:sugar ABC transporter ATP-binding protein [Spirochaetia bacterium]
MTDPLLECRTISKSFPGIRALDEVDFTLLPGEVHALVGENGAGKSTLVKILTGIYRPDSGTISLSGHPVEFRSPVAAQAAGIAAIHQEATMFSDLTVTENIYMGHHQRMTGFPLLSWGAMRRRTRALLAELELDIDPDLQVRSLSVAQRHMVEIVKALSLEARIVIMDEPTSALTLREVEDLFAIVRRLRDAGKAVVFISHKFEDIYGIADRFTVLRDGRLAGQGLVRETGVDQIIRMMIGRSLTQMYPKIPVEPGEVLLNVRGLSRAGVFRDVSFELRRGEILGFFGLVGAGRSEVMRAVFGVDRADAGSVRIDGREVTTADPRSAMASGIAYVPEDRQVQGAILAMNIRENTTLAVLDRLSNGSWLNLSRERALTDEYGARMEIKAGSWEQSVNSLSGGNQQKVVLAKWLATQPRVLILDEPTKGIDVATKARVHEFITHLAKDGLGIILVSSEMPEILGMSDSIVVMHEGRVTARFRRDEADQEKLLKAAMGRMGS